VGARGALDGLMSEAGAVLQASAPRPDAWKRVLNHTKQAVDGVVTAARKDLGLEGRAD